LSASPRGLGFDDGALLVTWGSGVAGLATGTEGCGACTGGTDRTAGAADGCGRGATDGCGAYVAGGADRGGSEGWGA